MADQQKILELIEEAARTGSEELDLRKNELTRLPPEIAKLTNLTSLDLSENQLTSPSLEIAKLRNLTSLDLSRNQLTSLPPEFARLTKLTSLDLAHNKLSSLPTEIKQITGLTRLDLWGNEFASLPAEITELTKLTSLNLYDNQLTKLPPEIAKLTNLAQLFLAGNRLMLVPREISKLINLTTLDLSETELTSVPPEIKELTNLTNLYLYENQLTSLPLEIGNLTNLIILELNHNKLTSLPPEIAKLTNLASLDLSENQLINLPPEFAKLTNLATLNLRENQLTNLPPEIAKLTNLTRLNLRGNHLTNVPPEIAKLTDLTSLNLSRNRLTNVPPEIAKLTNLTSLDLGGNQLPIPPETLAEPGDIKAIFAAIAGLFSGERLNEAKMLVVGDGKVGKSSVVEQLLGRPFNPGKQTTLGVEINDEMQVVQSEVQGESEPIKLNIWDFGGQEIQHSTHQFFLTTRSLYLLVVDARKGEQLSNIEYWLKLIESFGGGSPTIIVINQIDQLKGARPLNLDRKALQDKYNIRDFVETSCATGAGIPELKAAITREVDQMKHVHDLWPREWMAIKKRLKDTHADYIPVEKYFEICDEEELNDGDLRQSLLGLLHDLGVVIRFPGDTQVLNPRWVTQGVYGLLTSAKLVKSLGQFDLKDVGEILEAIPETRGRYPSHTHHRLIDVMKHFELCFEFTDRPGHYLIPRHLHDNELDIPWDGSDALRYQYDYETLPDSIISRFIVRMNQYIIKQYYWKNGVFLSDGGNRAKIKADLVDRKIFISVIGKKQTRRAFLTVIRSAFDEINSSFKIGIKRMIPLPDYPTVLVSYDDLIVFENNNRQRYFVATPGVEMDYNVRQLLDGVEDVSLRLRRRESEERILPRRISEEPPLKSQQRTPEPENKPLGSLMSFVFAFIVLLAAIVGAAIAISKWVSITAGVMTGVIIIGALLAIGVIGAMDLRNRGILSEQNFLKLMVESYKRLPLLRGKE
jgi:small GTP-binding protein